MAVEPAELRKSRTSFSKSVGKIQSGTGGVGGPCATGAKQLSRTQVRRASYGFGSVPGIRPIERTSQLGIEYKRPLLTYYPTYQVEPSVKFHHAKTRAVIEDTLDEHFRGFKYHPQESPAIAVRMAAELMRKVKALNFNRYRIISVVTIGQKRSQSYNNAVAFIWDGQRDGYVEVHREVTTAFIQVTIFGVYLD